MRPILFTLGPFTISSYPVMICLGACLSIWLSLREIDRLGLDRPTYITICLIGFSSGVVGARIMNCIVFYDLYRGKPWWKLLAIWEGGMAMYGGVILALPLCYAYVRVKRLSFWQVTDTLAPPWMMLLIVARLPERLLLREADDGSLGALLQGLGETERSLCDHPPHPALFLSGRTGHLHDHVEDPPETPVHRTGHPRLPPPLAPGSAGRDA